MLPNPINFRGGCEGAFVVGDAEISGAEVVDKEVGGIVKKLRVWAGEENIVVVNEPQDLRVGLQGGGDEVLHLRLRQCRGPAPAEGKT